MVCYRKSIWVYTDKIDLGEEWHKGEVPSSSQHMPGGTPPSMLTFLTWLKD